MATPNIVPRADGEGGLGSSSKYWGSAYIDLIYVGAGKIGRDADNLLDFSSDNLIYFRLGAGNEFLMANNMFGPAASDGAALGNSTYKWSDLFLASGAVINFDNGNVTLTHSSNALTLADSDVLAFGAGSDLQLSHDATNSHIANYNGDLKITNNANDKDIVFLCDDGSGGNTAYLTLDGGLGYTVAEKNIRFQDSVRARFGTSNDFDIYHNGTNSVIDNYTNNLEIRNFADDGDIIFKSDDGSGGTTEYFRLDGGNEGSYFSKHVHLIDSVQLRIGNGNDAAFYHDSVDTYLANATGDFYIQNTANDKDITFQSDDGSGGLATYFYLDGSSATHDGSATTALYTNWPDNSKISFGTSHDLRVYHDGTNSYVHNDTGDLYIENDADNGDIAFRSDNGTGGLDAYLVVDGTQHTIDIFKQTHFYDSVSLYLGTGNDLQLVHDSANSKIVANGAGDLIITQGTVDQDIIFKCDDGSGGETAYITLDGGYSSPQIIVPDNVAFNVGSGLDFNIIHNGSNTTLTNNIGNLTILNNTDDGDIIFQSDDGSGGVETYFFLDGSASSGNPYTIFPDNSHLGFGSGYGDLQLHHNGTSSYIKNRSTGDLYIMNEADDKDIIFQSDDGSGGVTAYITLDGSTNTVTFYKTLEIKDNVPASFGNSGDLTIKHDGSNGYMQNNTGDLTITNNTDDGDINFQSDNGSGGTATYFTVDGGAVRTNFAKELRTLDDVKFKAGTSGDLEIYHDGNNSYISNIKDNSYLLFQNDDGAGGLATYFVLDGNAATHDGSATTALFTNWPDKSYISLGTGHDLQMHHNGVDTIIGNNTGDLKIRQFANDKDIVFDCDDGSGGTTTYFFLDGGLSNSGYVYTNFPDNSVLTFGTAPDLQIFHDSSNSYIQDSGTGTLYVKTNSFRVRNSGGSEDIIKALEDGAVTLYYDNAAKLATTSTGVEVTGGVSITSSAIVAVGAGFDGAETCDIQIGEVNQEIITTIQIDLGTGGATDIVSSGTAGDVIGENDTAAAYITKYDSTKNGVLYKAELICLETPVGGDTDINLVLNATSLAEDAAGETEGHVIVDGGAQTIGMRTESTASVITAAAGAHNDYIYLTHGGTTAGTYSAGKFLIRLYGAKAAL